jgi:hypothetical protein
MRDKRTVLGPLSETITLADVALNIGLDLEGVYALCQTHGVRVAARPTTRISRDSAERLREARHGDLLRELRATELEPPQEDPAITRARAALGDPSPAAMSAEDAETAALARHLGVQPHSEPERRPRRPRPTTRRPRPNWPR